MKKPLLLLIVAALLGAVGCWLLGGADGDPELTPPTEHGAVDEQPDPGIGNAGGPSATVDATAATPEPTARDAVLTHEALVELPADAKWIEVRIVDRESRAPVPAADVSWYDDTVTQQLQNLPERIADHIGTWRDHEALATRFGWRTQSDAKGIARIHQTPSTRVCARRDDRYGFAELGSNLLPPRGGYEVAIEPDFAVRVQVLCSDGAPAIGVPVGIARHDTGGKFQGFRNWGAEALTQAPDGIAVLTHAQSWRRDGEQVPQWHAHLTLPGIGNDKGVPVQLDPPPSTPVVLRLPDCGSVRVRVELRADGDTRQRMVALRENSRNSRGWERGLQEPLGADGWARFPFVPIGLQLNAGISANGGWLAQNFAGPVAAGACVDVTLAPETSHVLFAGRLLDENRQPLPRQKFSLRTTGQNSNSAESTTDDGGGFLVLIGNTRNERNQIDGIQAHTTPADGRARVARLPGRELRAGTENLGDIVLGFDPIVVAGHYVVDGKARKAEASAFVERLQPPSENGRQENWERLEDLGQASQQDDGSFELRGVVEPGRYRLRVWPNRAAPVEPIEFRLGATDVTVELRTGGAIAATVLLPKAPAAQVRGRLVPVDAPGATTLPQNQRRRLEAESWQRPENRHQLDWQPPPEGVYRLEILLPGFPDEPLAVIDDVRVPGPTGGDARLVDIDLTGLVRLQQIRVTDELGKVVQHWEGGMFPLPFRAKTVEGLPAQGSTTFLMPLRTVDLLVAFPGYRPRSATCNGQPVELRMDHWPTVTLLVAPVPELPPGCELIAGLAPAADPDDRQFRTGWNSGSLARLQAPPQTRQQVKDGKVELPVGEAPQRIDLTVRKQRRSVAVEIPLQTATMASGTIAVQFTAAAVQKAAAEAAAKKQ